MKSKPSFFIFRHREKQEKRFQEEEKANAGEGEANEEKYEEITLTLILNRICGGKYKHPNEFWAQLGQMFKNCVISYPDDSSSYRKMADKLRLLTYHLYVDWYSLFTDKEKDKQRRIIEAEKVKFVEIRNEMRKKKREEWKAETVERLKKKKGENGGEEEKKEEGKEEGKKEEGANGEADNPEGGDSKVQQDGV